MSLNYRVNNGWQTCENNFYWLTRRTFMKAYRNISSTEYSCWQLDMHLTHMPSHIFLGKACIRLLQTYTSPVHNYAITPMKTVVSQIFYAGRHMIDAWGRSSYGYSYSYSYSYNAVNFLQQYSQGILHTSPVIQWNLSVTTTSIMTFLPVIYSATCFSEDWRYQFTVANNFCLLGLI